MRPQVRTVAITAVVALAMAACDGGSSPPPAPTVTLTSSATDVGVPGPPVTLTWSSTHATSCTASGDWPQQEPWDHQLGTYGSQGFVVSQTSTYMISCSGRGGVATASVTIHAWNPPSASLTADLISVPPNGTVLLTWSSQNATECSGFLGLPGTTPTLPTSGSQMTAPLTETTLFRIICANPVFRAGIAEVVVRVVIPKFTVIELPIQDATALNDAGDVVGFRGSAGGGGPGDVVAWIDGAIVDVKVCPTPPNCYRYYFPRAINAARTVIGRGHYYFSPMHTFSFVWHYGDNPADIGGDTSDDLFLNDVNDAGRIVGGKGFGPRQLAMLISDDTVVLLFGLDYSDSVASAINAAGHIAGSFQTVSDAKYHVFLYVDGAIQDLGTLGGGDGGASDINAADAIVGWEESLQGTRAFRYADSGFTDLGSLGGTVNRATAINDAGQIVGTSTLAGADPQAQRAFLYVNDRMYDLNDLVAPLAVPLSEAPQINNRGQIIANGCPPPGTPSACRAYLLTPVSPP